MPFDFEGISDQGDYQGAVADIMDLLKETYWPAFFPGPYQKLEAEHPGLGQ